MTVKKVLTLIGVIILLVFSSLTIVASAIAGPHKLMFPGFFGFHEMAPNIFVPGQMRTTDRLDLLVMINNAESVVTDYFADSYQRPIIVICPTKQDCDPVFGRKDTQGVAYGKRVVRLNGDGISPEVAMHELSHTALKNHVGEWNTYFGAIPAWFDEGLAVFVSGDSRYSKSVQEEVLTALITTHSWQDWNPLLKKFGWRDVYGGAEILVRDIEEKIGKKGIMSILDDVANGIPFNETLDQKLSSSAHKSS